jgi:hypothetical protein
MLKWAPDPWIVTRSLFLQVACRWFDPQARFKLWDSVYIAIGKNCVAFGSSRDKAIERALGGGDKKLSKLIPTEGCCPFEVPEHAGRSQVLAFLFPNNPSVPWQYFAFEHHSTRASFLRVLLVR